MSEGMEKMRDLVVGGKGSGTEPDRSLGKGTDRSVKIRGAVQAGTDGDLEADIENGAQVLGRQARWRKER